MITLILDSATPTLYVSLVENEKVIYEKYQTGKNEHSKYIVSLIEEGLKLNNLSIDSLNKIVVGVGPGSYTGVRMAVSIAKMFGSFKSIPVYAVSTLYLMGSNYAEEVAVKIDARRNNVFGMIYDYKNNKYILEEGLYPNEDVNSNIIVLENNFKVNPIKCIKNTALVENIDTLSPNYLRETEAERNLK